MSNNGWPNYARPLTEKELQSIVVTLEKQYEQLSADVIILISGLQKIAHHTTDNHAKQCAKSALADYEQYRKDAKHNN